MSHPVQKYRWILDMGRCSLLTLTATPNAGVVISLNSTRSTAGSFMSRSHSTRTVGRGVDGLREGGVTEEPRLAGSSYAEFAKVSCAVLR